MLKQVVVLVTILIGLTGCNSQSGIKVDQAKLDQIQKGVTTRAEVEAKLGKPTSVMRLYDNSVSATYWHAESHESATNFIPYVNLVAGDHSMTSQTWTFIYDKNGVVQDIRTGEDNTDIKGGYMNYNPQISSRSE